MQTLLTISCSNLRLAVNSPPSRFGASFPPPSVGQGSLTSPSSRPSEAVWGGPPASCVSPMMEMSLQLQRPLRNSRSPSFPLSLHPCPPPVSPQPGQAHLGNPRAPLVKAERWSPVPASLRTLWSLSLPSLLAPGSCGPSSRKQPAARQTCQHSTHPTAPGLLTRPCLPAPPCRTPGWIHPGGPQQRRAKRAHPPRGTVRSPAGTRGRADHCPWGPAARAIPLCTLWRQSRC